ncbi:glycosyltransferase family 2 protein [Paenibacillus sp. YYML68]|uniref:glycosyltransferase family 2 protein n=1 Tax=Paenibacillus sp. YYML68 TaxID=2909250 RepID=UPI002490803C|nr:glycosyltransferase family 2 protein [Paenibacillus sp. YYML68]
MNKLVSVIIPTYKGAGKLARAIDSVLDQTYMSIEIIVVDDNDPSSQPRMETMKVMENYRLPNIHYLKHEHNKNGSAARNTGIAQAKGEYISFLDDDDFLFPDRIEKSVDRLLANSAYDAVYCGVIKTNSERIRSIIHARKPITQKDILLNEMAIGTGSNIFLTKRVLDEIGGFDESFIRNQDLEFMIRVLGKFQMIHLDELLIVKATNGNVNVPDYLKLKAVKDKFIATFETVIHQLSESEKKQFYRNHYSVMLESAIVSRVSAHIDEVVTAMEPYRRLVRKEKLLIFMVRIRFYRSKPYQMLSKSISWIKKLKPSEIRSVISNDKWTFIMGKLG